MTRLLKHRGKTVALFIMAGMVTLVIMLASCDTGQPDMLTGAGEVMLTLRLSLPGKKKNTSTRIITPKEEREIDITQLKVLVFKVSGTSELFAYEAPQVQLQEGQYTVTLRESTAGEKYRLVVIANAGKKLPVIPINTTKSDALRMITFDAMGCWNTFGIADYTLFPMWGEITVALEITPTTTLGNITLLRALARIDVGCALTGEEAAGISEFVMKSASVYRTKDKGYVAPVDGGDINNNVVTSVSVPADAGTNGALTYTCTDGKSLIRAIYVAETPQGSNKDDNVCLVIGGTYAGSINYYKVDLTHAGSYISIKRNCRYIVNIKLINKSGYDNEGDALVNSKTVTLDTTISANDWKDEVTEGSGTIPLS